jgi:hypothetical protein
VPPPGLRGGVGQVRLRLNRVLAESVPEADGNGSSDGNGHPDADREDQDSPSAKPAVPRGS